MNGARAVADPRTLDPNWRQAFSPRVRIWAAIRQLGRTCTADEVEELAGLPGSLVGLAMAAWTRRGLLVAFEGSFMLTPAGERFTMAPVIEAPLRLMRNRTPRAQGSPRPAPRARALAETAPAPTGTARQKVWTALRSRRGPCSAEAIAKAAGVAPPLAGRLLRQWTADGHLLRIFATPTLTRYLMDTPARQRIDPPRASSPRKRISVPRRSGRQRLWSAMRVLKTFDLTTLCLTAETSEANAGTYLRALLAAGYAGVAGEATFRLLRNTGPSHPVVSRRGPPLFTAPVLFDRNTGVIVDLAGENRGQSAPADGEIG